MRKPKYLSPSAINTFFADRDKYYRVYLAEHKTPRDLQTQPMAIGSALDARVKHYLVKELYDEVPPEFELERIFEDQVEKHNRDWAWEQSKELFKVYDNLGALADLLTDLSTSVIQPRFEFTAYGELQMRNFKVPISGKPDCFFVNEEGARIVVDWKVNGFCSQRGVSPKPGYIKLRPGGNWHRDAQPMRYKGVMINIAQTIDKQWADQLCMYAWVLGEPIGGDFVAQIEQFACAPNQIRVATHRSRIPATYQQDLINRIEMVWDIIQSGHIFRDRSKTDSLEHQFHLEIAAEKAAQMLESGNTKDKAFMEMM